MAQEFGPTAAITLSALSMVVGEPEARRIFNQAVKMDALARMRALVLQFDSRGDAIPPDEFRTLAKTFVRCVELHEADDPDH